MKNLIVYYSFTGNNDKLATHLQKRINCDIVKIETIAKRTGLSILLDLMFKRKPKIKPIHANLRQYDHVILLAPIWAGKIAMPLKSFLIDEKKNIRSYSFITLCGGGNPKQMQHVQDELTSVLETAPSRVLELWVNNLLPVEKRNTIKYTSGFRIEDNGFAQFEEQIRDFLHREQLVGV